MYVFKGGLPWGWVSVGGAVAVFVVFSDFLLKRLQVPFSLPVLGFAVGFCKSHGESIFSA
jgi:uncharacterized oligopeptide transporter (OPT) family protein